MKTVKNTSVILLIISLLIISACQQKTVEHKKYQIITSIYPYELLVKQLVGDKADVMTLIPTNASPHTYSPLPADVKLLNNSDLIISNGMNLEKSFDKIFIEFKTKHLITSEFISNDLFIIDEDEHHSDSDHDHPTGNPHIWTNPQFLIKIAQGIVQKLNSDMPENKAFFDNNLSLFIKEISALDDKISSERKNYKNANMLFFHDSFAYFNQRYHIYSAGVIEQFPGKEPSPADMVNIGNIIKQFKVKAVLIEPQLNPKPAEIIAKEFNLKVIKYDPLGSTIDVNNIIEFLEKNWEVLKQGLS